MRPLPFVILLYAALGLQLGLGDVLGWGTAGPELALAAATWVALRARPVPAAVGGLLLGLGRDLIGDGPPGALAFAYALAALVVRQSAKDLASGSPLVAGLAGLLAAVVANVAAATLLALNDAAAAPPVRATLASTLLTALVTPIVVAVLDRFRPAFGFRRSAFEKR